MIYFDSAATSFYRPDQVAQAVADAIRTMGNCSRGTYETALESARVIFETRQLIDELFDGFGPEQTAFTMNSTESLNMAIKGVLRPGDQAVTTVLEHNSVLRPLYQMEEQGVNVTYIGCRGNACEGLLDMEALHDAIVPGVKAVICANGSNLTGNILDIRTIGRWCRQAGALLIVDASQTAGVFPISMKEDGIDILCFTGHKGLLGPQGTGGICVREGLVLQPLLSGGSGIMTYEKRHPARMPVMLEAGTLNGHGIAGLRAALLWIKAQGGVEPIRRREEHLARLFYQNVKEIPGIRLYGYYGSYENSRDSWLKRTAMVTLNLGDADSGEVSDWLAEEHGVYTRSGGHCAPLTHQTLGTKAQGAVRFSFSYFNTEEEVLYAAKALKDY